MKSIPMIDGSEMQALTGERKVRSWNPGVRKGIKRQIARRSRAQARRALRQDAQ